MMNLSFVEEMLAIAFKAGTYMHYSFLGSIESMSFGSVSPLAIALIMSSS